jgi:WD40 repeat protein
LAPHTDSVEAVGFQPGTNERAATGSLDKSVKVWNVSTLQLVSTFEHDDGVVRLKWHPTKPLLFTGSSDRTVRMWDSRSGKCEKIFSGHRDTILDFAING